MTTRVVFLDIDGVVNSHDWWTRRTLEQRHADEGAGGIRGGVDPRAMARVNKLCALGGAVVVVSSTVRIRRGFTDLDVLRATLRRYGLSAAVIDKTPRLAGRQRGEEIQAWLDANTHRNVASFVIIDDDADMVHLRDRLVQTTFEHGLEDEHVERAVEMLRERAAA